MRNILCDILIIGAGPAGCMAALAALKADPDLDVVVLEEHSEPKYRIGEALLTGTVMAFDMVGIADEIAAAGYHHKIGASYIWGETRDPWYVNYPDMSHGYPDSFSLDGKRVSIHVPRHILDAQLRELAERRGAKIMIAKASNVVSQNDSVEYIELSDGSRVHARRYIDSTGQASVLGRAMTVRRPVWTPRVARYFYTDQIDWTVARANGFDPHRTNIVSHKNGWAWIIHLGKKGGDRTSVGFVIPSDVAPTLQMDNAFDEFPLLAAFGLDKTLGSPTDPYGNRISQFIGHPDYSYRCDKLHGTNWALAGDAALFLDPILSQGVTLATHYGALRGFSAAAALQESSASMTDDEVTGHYLKEAEILKVIIGQWYDNNRSVEGWRGIAKGISDEVSSFDQDPVSAFRYITNLENLFENYGAYPTEVQADIEKHLGCQKK